MRSWRVTTAVRAFALALGTGQALQSNILGPTAPLLFALLTVAFVGVVLELGVIDRGKPWIPVVEGIIAGTLLASDLRPEPLLVYLVVPSVVAGVRHGWVTTMNTWLTTTIAVLATGASWRNPGLDVAGATESLPWLGLGLGAGLLAAWQSRSVRRLEASQAPAAEAHHLVAQLHNLTRKVTVGLDSVNLAAGLADRLRDDLDATSSAVLLLGESGGLEPLALHGMVDGLEGLARDCLGSGQAVIAPDRAALPLRAGDHVFGVVAVSGYPSPSRDALNEAQSVIDALAVQLDTALLFEDITVSATTEERNRLAREMHDGIAQEIVGLGYLVDEIEALSEEPATRAAAAAMRGEVTRLVSELRFSIFDLRHEVSDQNLSGALAEYVREISIGSDLRVHLLFDEQGSPLSRRIESELMRVAQEAIANVRKHAQARNMWITFETDGAAITLRIEDDGVGAATPRDRHYGLHTMRERAERIHADLTVTSRAGGGTVVSLRSRSHAHLGDGLPHEHHSPAGR